MAGNFAVVIGVATVVFMAANWGLRSYVALESFRQHHPVAYLVVRSSSIFLAALVVYAVSELMGLAGTLATVAVLLKASDSLLDLSFGFHQAHKTPSAALRVHAVAAYARAAASTAVLATAWAIPGVDLLYATLAQALTAFVTTAMVVGHSAGSAVSATRVVPKILPSVRQMLRGATPYALASFVCAALTTAPRLAAGQFYTGETLGVAGTSLTIGSFFGMIYYTTWVRWLPRLRQNPFNGNLVTAFVGETLVASSVLTVASWTVLPHVASLIFGYSSADQIDLARMVLCASAIFFGAMNAANIFKLAGSPYFESAVYVAGLIGLGLSAAAWVVGGGLPQAMLVSSGLMSAAVSLFFFATIMRFSASKE